MRFYIILLIYLLLVSCSSPNEERVRNEFLAENPDYTVTSIYVGEGDSSNVYYHITTTSDIKNQPIRNYTRMSGFIKTPIG